MTRSCIEAFILLCSRWQHRLCADAAVVRCELQSEHRQTEERLGIVRDTGPGGMKGAG